MIVRGGQNMMRGIRGMGAGVVAHPPVAPVPIHMLTAQQTTLGPLSVSPKVWVAKPPGTAPATAEEQARAQAAYDARTAPDFSKVKTTASEQQKAAGWTYDPSSGGWAPPPLASSGLPWGWIAGGAAALGLGWMLLRRKAA